MSNIILSLNRKGTGLFASDSESEEIIKTLSFNENYNVSLTVKRNLLMHKAYFSVLSFVYDNLPEHLQKRCKKQHFYKLLKELQGRFEIVYKNDYTEIKEYESLNFSSMSEKRFHEVFKEDLNFIISDILEPLKMKEFIEILVTEYERTLTKYKL